MKTALNNQPQLFKNHSRYKRQVRVNEDFTICDVFSIRRASKDDDPHYQTTYQDPNVGRYIIIKHNNNDPIQIFDLTRSFHQIGGRSLSSRETEEIIAKLPPIIIEWLYDVDTQMHSNFIPPGFGWDGKFTQSEYNKRQTAALLFTPRHAKPCNIERKWLDEVLDEICRTPKSYLNLKWTYASAFPENRLLKYTNSIQTKDYVFIHDDGSVVVQPRKRIIGDVGSYPGMLIPKDVDRVIVLTHGVICKDDGRPAGIQVELFQDFGV